jgi:pyruvate kinase
MEGVSIKLRPEQRVLLDDGKIEAVVLEVDGRMARVRVVRAVRDSVSIRAEKGVNFPDSEIDSSALSARDREVLPEVLELADLVGISFVRRPDDLREALDSIRAAALARQSTTLPGIIVKLETAYALRSLPELLLQAMHHHPVGVMIARGDLAVEAGFERLAELQQEILWFAEAAHLPVVWATQVLDNLARTGIPSRAEVTDASMSVQAECVMLNKGPYVADACHTLDTIIRRMEKHQFKKRNLYRSLKISLSMDPVAGPMRIHADEK